MFSFFAKAKVLSLSDALCASLAKLDPQTMSEAGMLQLEQQLDEVCRETALAKNDYLKEQREADLIKETYNNQLTAAEIMQKRMSAASETDSIRIEASLNVLLTKLESLAKDVEVEEKEAVQAKQLFEQMESTCQELADQFKNARKMFEDMQRQMKSALATEVRAKATTDRALMLQGIQNGSGKLGSAMDAMKAATANAQANADAAQRKATLLTPTNVEEDDEIASALREAKGETSTTNMSVADRLAALKKS